MIIVTGGAGLIGSALVWGLNQRGERDIVIVDEIDHDEKELNIAHLHYERLVGVAEFRQQLASGDWDDKGVEAILHMGANSSTTETNWEHLVDNNVEYTQELIRWCVDHHVRCIYASSAATYGDGEQGFSDDHDLFDQLKPLNLYGKSKLQVDIWARDAGYLDQVVGLRYFNVYGPNELHKEHMRSVVAKKFDQLQEHGYIELFKSYRDDYKDGQQERDFIYVKDAVAATLFFLDMTEITGIFNIGTGEARTWHDVARAMFRALGMKPNITYIDMPADIRDQYQYHTQADITKLRAAGFTTEFAPLDDAIKDYIVNYLRPKKHLGE